MKGPGGCRAGLQAESLVLPAPRGFSGRGGGHSLSLWPLRVFLFLLTPFSRDHTELCSDTALILGFSSSWDWVEAAWSVSCRSLFVCLGARRDTAKINLYKMAA